MHPKQAAKASKINMQDNTFRYNISIISLMTSLLMVILVSACSGTKYLDEGDMLLKGSTVVSSDKSVDVSSLQSYILQRPNTKWLSTFKVPLGIYSMSGRDTTRWINRTLRRWGEAPVALDTALTDRTALILTQAMQNKGYLNAMVEPEVLAKNSRCKVVYNITPGQRYTIRNVSYDIADGAIDTLLRYDDVLRKSEVKPGSVFSVNALSDERKRITSYLNNRGYYLFNKEFITFDVDSSMTDRIVDITMHLDLYRRNAHTELTQHPLYTVRSITYDRGDSPAFLRKKVLELNTMLEQGRPYSSSALQQTYNKFARLQAVRYTNVHFTENPDSQFVDCHIQLSPHKTNSIQFMPEGTNTAGDLGAAASLTYQNRNLFHGSEVLSITARGAYEAIHDLEGYSNEDYREYGIEANLTFPRYLMPWVSRAFQRRSNATSELTVSYNNQNRPEFHRRVFTAGWRYKWSSPSQREQYKFDVIDLNYISMPWISETFKHDYLDSVSNRNTILRYNYQDLLIMKMGFGYTKTSAHSTIRVGFESAGNLLNALSRPLNLPKNDQGQYKVFRIAYAQYVKGDVDYTHLLQFDRRNTLALHARLGIAYPYGNSTILPFEKRYFSGGANSVRGWTVRSLGPGSYSRTDGRIDFINQTGDVRLDLNAEMRSDLFWRFQGAIFVDAGNIWTIRNYTDQPGGQFNFIHFWQQMAVAYGVGLRLNFSYFIIRFDMGMKAINPVYDTPKQHFPAVYPNFSRDHCFHFAVGLPF